MAAAMLSLTACTSLFVALLFYFVYNEKLKLKHLIGVLFILSSALTIGASKFNFDDLANTEFSKILIPIGFVML